MPRLLHVIVFISITTACSHGADDELAKLAKGLKEKDAKARLRAIDDIAKLGKEAAPIAKELCDVIAGDKDAKVRLAALQTLEKVRPDLYKPVSTFLLDANAGNQLNALRELEKLGTEAAPASGVVASKLIRSASDTAVTPGDFFTIKCDTLKSMGVADADAIKSIRAVASPLNVRVADRCRAIQFLAAWAKGDAERTKGLIDGLKVGLGDRTEDVVLACIRATQQIAAKELLPVIQKLKLSSNKQIRDLAEEAAAKLEKP